MTATRLSARKTEPMKNCDRNAINRLEGTHDHVSIVLDILTHNWNHFPERINWYPQITSPSSLATLMLKHYYEFFLPTPYSTQLCQFRCYLSRYVILPCFLPLTSASKSRPLLVWLSTSRVVDTVPILRVANKQRDYDFTWNEICSNVVSCAKMDGWYAFKQHHNPSMWTPETNLRVQLSVVILRT